MQKSRYESIAALCVLSENIGIEVTYVFQHVEQLGWRVVRSAHNACALCAWATIKRKPFKPDGMHVIGNQRTGRRVYIDLSWAKTKVRVACPYWLIVVEEQTQAKFSIFLARKKDLPKQLCNFYTDGRLQG